VPATSNIVTGVAAGTAVLTYTVNTGCFITTVFTVNPNPDAIAGPLTLCTGSAITLTDAMEGGTWINSNIGRAIVGSATGVIVGTTAGTFTVTYAMPTGCRASIALTVNQSPAISGTAALNVGATATLSSSVTWWFVDV
jgi:hypothetical protein